MVSILDKPHGDAPINFIDSIAAAVTLSSTQFELLSSWENDNLTFLEYRFKVEGFNESLFGTTIFTSDNEYVYMLQFSALDRKNTELQELVVEFENSLNIKTN